MADNLKTLADLLQVNQGGLDDIEVNDLLQDAPFLRSLVAKEASEGTQHKYLKETSAPVIGFRDINAGRDMSKSGKTQVTVNLKILDASFELDQAWVDNYGRGKEAALREEGLAHLRAAFFGAEQQFLNGIVGANSDGFQGMADVLANSDDDMVFDAGGTSVGAATSVYLVRMGENDVSAVTGKSGNIEIGESTITQGADATGKKYSIYWTPILAWLGLQVGSKYSFGRICNLTEQAGKSLTDEMIYKSLKKFPAGRKPNAIVGNADALEMLRSSRTATNQTGAPAPIPEEVSNIKFIETDGITSTETLLTAA